MTEFFSEFSKKRISLQSYEGNEGQNRRESDYASDCILLGLNGRDHYDKFTEKSIERGDPRCSKGADERSDGSNRHPTRQSPKLIQHSRLCLLFDCAGVEKKKTLESGMVHKVEKRSEKP